MNEIEETAAKKPSKTDSLITLFLGGDVMTGRGIDQVLPYAGDPTIHEPYLKSAREYAELSEEANGPIPQPVDFSYIWGDALDELELLSPDVRIINLETSITESDDYWKDKAIHYRMNPKNIPCITAARVDFCSLANNHILDWGYSGLTETLETLEKVNIKNAGAGRNLKEAATPAVMEVHGRGKVIVFSFGSGSSGIPLDWEASENKPGVNLLPDLSMQTVHYYKSQCYEKGMVGLDILVFFANWQSQFCRLLYRNTERGDLREIIKNYIFQLHDRIIDGGFYRNVGKFPERQSSVEVASALEGLNDAYAIAIQKKDHALHRYKECICLALSYLLEVQCTTHCAEKEKGGLGFSLTNRTQRIDYWPCCRWSHKEPSEQR